MDWFASIKKYGVPSLKQWKHYIVTVLIIAFIIGFNDRSGNGMGVEYFSNMLLSFLIVAFSIFFSNLVSRIHSAMIGYKSQYNFSINGLLVGIMLAFVSNGFFWYLSPGYHIVRLDKTGRLGQYRYGLKMCDWSRTAASGSFAYILLALIAYLSARGNPVVDLFVKINIMLGLYSMLPFPENNGLNIFFGQRSLYFFTLFAMLAVLLAMRFLNNIFLIIVIGVIVAIAGTIYWFTQVEK
jgi:hypothetical protein